MKVPIIDLVASYNEQKEALNNAAIEVLSSGYYVSGPKVAELEKVIADYCGSESAIAVASGTEALRLVLQAMNVGVSDEILTPVFTFFACASTIAINNAKPVFVDMHPDDFNLDPDDIMRRITPKTRGIVVVHLYGYPARMDEILKIAKKHKLFVIEDCAQAIGAEYNGNKVGSMGDAGTYSFYPTKNLHACGEGGMIISSNVDLVEKLRLLRSHGENPRYHHHLLGLNCRMDEIQAAFIRVKFDLLDKWNNRRKEIAGLYNDAFKDSEIKIPPVKNASSEPVYHTYTIRAKNRDKLVDWLKSREIGVMLYYPVPMHLQPVFKNLGYSQGDYPNAESACKEVLSIPIDPHLTNDQVEYVIESINQFLKS